MRMYTSAKPVSVLGCFEQLELCNPNSDNDRICAMVPSECDIKSITASLAFNHKQEATFDRLYDSLGRVNLPKSAYALGGGGLLASSYAQDDLSPGLPSNQWELEVQNWFATSLTALQLFTVQYVTGYGRPDFNKFVTPPIKANEWMCSNQIVQRNDFASFSVLGLATILVCCSLIIVLSMSISRVAPLISGQSTKVKRNDHEWRAYDILNLESVTPDEATASLGKPHPLSIPQRTQQRVSFMQRMKKFPRPRWPFQGRSARRQPPEQHDESPVSTTDLLPCEKVFSRSSADTEIASPTSPESALVYEKV